LPGPSPQSEQEQLSAVSPVCRTKINRGLLWTLPGRSLRAIGFEIADFWLIHSTWSGLAGCSQIIIILAWKEAALFLLTIRLSVSRAMFRSLSPLSSPTLLPLLFLLSEPTLFL